MAKIHVVIAAFFLPAALIFNLTGGLKLLQYKADKDETIRFQVELDKANPLGVRDMWDFANEHLGERGIEPVDAHALKGRKGSYVWPFISTPEITRISNPKAQPIEMYLNHGVP